MLNYLESAEHMLRRLKEGLNKLFFVKRYLIVWWGGLTLSFSLMVFLLSASPLPVFGALLCIKQMCIDAFADMPRATDGTGRICISGECVRMTEFFPATVDSFTVETEGSPAARNASVKYDKKFTLRWRVTNAEKIELVKPSAAVQDISAYPQASLNQRSLNCGSTITYTIRAYTHTTDQDPADVQHVTLAVADSLPDVREFFIAGGTDEAGPELHSSYKGERYYTSKRIHRIGDEYRINWNVQCATRLFLTAHKTGIAIRSDGTRTLLTLSQDLFKIDVSAIPSGTYAARITDDLMSNLITDVTRFSYDRVANPIIQFRLEARNTRLSSLLNGTPTYNPTIHERVTHDCVDGFPGYYEGKGCGKNMRSAQFSTAGEPVLDVPAHGFIDNVYLVPFLFSPPGHYESVNPAPDQGPKPWSGETEEDPHGAIALKASQTARLEFYRANEPNKTPDTAVAILGDCAQFDGSCQEHDFYVSQDGYRLNCSAVASSACRSIPAVENLDYASPPLRGPEAYVVIARNRYGGRILSNRLIVPHMTWRGAIRKSDDPNTLNTCDGAQEDYRQGYACIGGGLFGINSNESKICDDIVSSSRSNTSVSYHRVHCFDNQL